MLGRIPRAWWLVATLICFLYLFDLAGAGMLGPDEPRYAAIGREMARSGDWITPRLWGAPWFEKPALLYWMTAAGFKLGLNEDLAPRVPVALASLAFLIFFFTVLRREFGERAAGFATIILATCAGWLGYSQIGVTDLPMSAAFSAAMLLALPWATTGDRRALPLAAALFGLAVLAKGLVPLVLAAPLVWFGRRRLGDLIHPRFSGVFLLVAAPWYVLCWLRNGQPFIDVFFWVHQVGRFSSDSLLHRQPFWFYLPVLAGALLPWTPLVALLVRRQFYADARRAFLLGWLVFGFVFFSASTNKLPGYLLPLLPAAAALMGSALAERKHAPVLLAACGALLVAVPVMAQILPQALAHGLSRAGAPAFSWTWLAAGAVAAAAFRLRNAGTAMVMLGMATAVGVAYLKLAALPAIDQAYSTRPVWREIRERSNQVCVGEIHRAMRYGLNYYSVAPLPTCDVQPRPLQVVSGGADQGSAPLRVIESLP